jgi:hypothetical protein
MWQQGNGHLSSYSMETRRRLVNEEFQLAILDFQEKKIYLHQRITHRRPVMAD